jgi:ADP-ribose pyrophosphatase YjhB (NUDIX family)
MSLYPNTFYRVSIKALIEQDNKILLVKEDNWKWELPGGWLDHWEDPQTWLEREIMEEMWLQTHSIANNPSYFLTWFENNKWKSNVVYKTTLDNFEFTPSEECVEIWFYGKEEALKLDLFPNVIKFFEIYK